MGGLPVDWLNMFLNSRNNCIAQYIRTCQGYTSCYNIVHNLPSLTSFDVMNNFEFWIWIWKVIRMCRSEWYHEENGSNRESDSTGRCATRPEISQSPALYHRFQPMRDTGRKVSTRSTTCGGVWRILRIRSVNVVLIVERSHEVATFWDIITELMLLYSSHYTASGNSILCCWHKLYLQLFYLSMLSILQLTRTVLSTSQN